MDILYKDRRILVAVKPCGVLSTDEAGGMPSLLRQALGDPQACVRTVHRLDRVTGGVMVFARSRMAASLLSQQIRDHQFQKEYLAIVHGCPADREATLSDLLLRRKEEQKSYVVQQPEKGAQEAVLHYTVLSRHDGLSLVHIRLHTGRTHQIRVQFSERGLPLLGDRKYGGASEDGELALWSFRLRFTHPETNAAMEFSQLPPNTAPWSRFPELFEKRM